MDWYQKLVQLGVPTDLATVMAPDLQQLPYSPDEFTDVRQVVAVARDYGMQSLDWWDDLMAWLQYFLQTLIDITPGIILTAAGGALVYFLRNVKVRNIPIGLVGLAPMGYGIWLIAQPFLDEAFCNSFTTESECTINGCRWWTDSTCHSKIEAV